MRTALLCSLLFAAAPAFVNADPSPRQSTPTPTPTPTNATSGVIARRELTRVLDLAPGVFFQHVVPEPRFRAGRFHGWRLAQFFPGDARFAGVDVRAGDVIRSVNGSSVERPEQLMQVWDGLRHAGELVVELERAGVVKRLRWTIAD